MEFQQETERQTHKRKIDDISSSPKNGNTEKILKNPRKNGNITGPEERVTLSFNAFQKHLNSLKNPSQSQPLTQNNISQNQNFVAPQILGQEIEDHKTTSDETFTTPLPRKTNFLATKDLSTDNQSTLSSENSNSTNNSPYFGTRYTYNPIGNTSFLTASVVKFPLDHPAFKSRDSLKVKPFEKPSEPKTSLIEENEPIIIKTGTDKPLYVDDALLQRFMNMFEE